MSRAFVNEDAQGREPTYQLPKRDDPGYDEAAASVLSKVTLKDLGAGRERD